MNVSEASSGAVPHCVHCSPIWPFGRLQSHDGRVNEKAVGESAPDAHRVPKRDDDHQRTEDEEPYPEEVRPHLTVGADDGYEPCDNAAHTEECGDETER